MDSGSIDVSAPGESQFLCQTLDREESRFFNLNVALKDTYLFMTLEEQEPSQALIQIENKIPTGDLQVNQYGVNDCYFVVKNEERLPFAWNQPSKETKLVVRLMIQNEISSEIICSLDEINKMRTEFVSIRTMNVTGSNKTVKVTVSYCVILQGNTRTIQFYAGEKKEIVGKNKSNSATSLLIRTNLGAIGISLISTASHQKNEIAYICFAPIIVAYVFKDDILSFQIRILTLVIDNNSSEYARFPVILFPEKSTRVKGRDLPFLDIVCNIRNKKQPTDVKFFDLKY